MNRLNPSVHTPPKFVLEQTVKVPKEVHSSCRAKVVGQEWSDDNQKSKKKSNTWLYQLKFDSPPETEGHWFVATEEELMEWNK